MLKNGEHFFFLVFIERGRDLCYVDVNLYRLPEYIRDTLL